MLLHIRQEAAPAADELEQPAAGVVILRMCPQMLGQIVDALREERDLHLRRAGVFLVRPMLLDDLLFHFLRKAHLTSRSSVPANRRKEAESRGCGRRTG